MPAPAGPRRTDRLTGPSNIPGRPLRKRRVSAPVPGTLRPDPCLPAGASQPGPTGSGASHCRVRTTALSSAPVGPPPAAWPVRRGRTGSTLPVRIALPSISRFPTSSPGTALARPGEVPVHRCDCGFPGAAEDRCRLQLIREIVSECATRLSKRCAAVKEEARESLPADATRPSSLQSCCAASHAEGKYVGGRRSGPGVQAPGQG